MYWFPLLGSLLLLFEYSLKVLVEELAQGLCLVDVLVDSF